MPLYPTGVYPPGVYPPGMYGTDPASYPVLSVTLSGLTATATISEVDAAAICYLLYRASNESTWTAGGERTGSGVLVVTGLVAGVQYHFIAYYELNGSNSLPSLPVVLTTESALVTSVSGLLSDGLVYMLQDAGETIDFYPAGLGSGSRAILAIVDRLGAQSVPGAPEGSTEVYRLVVLNDPVNGISTTEINCLKSAIGIPRRPGLTKVIKVLYDIELQDEVGLQIMAA